MLYLVCDAIHAEAERQISEALTRTAGGRETLAAVIREYFQVCDQMSDHILLVYQETQSLPSQWRRKVLENEVRFTGLFKGVLARLVTAGELPALEERTLELVAHNITVLGHMWTFRRWFLSSHYSIEEYIRIQTDFIIGMMSKGE